MQESLAASEKSLNKLFSDPMLRMHVNLSGGVKCMSEDFEFEPEYADFYVEIVDFYFNNKLYQQVLQCSDNLRKKFLMQSFYTYPIQILLESEKLEEGQKLLE